LVRLGKNLGWGLVLAVAFLGLPRYARGQTPQTATPQTTTAQTPAASTTATPPTAAKPAPAITHRSKKKAAAAVAEAPPTPPPPPPTLEQTPPSAPRISYQNGQLTIEAHNSTLSQVLRAVQLQTGASIDIPGGANAERVVGQIGPGQPRDVLNTLLNGSKFDYVILGVTGNPGAVQKVVLTPRQSSGSSVSSAQNNSAAQSPESVQEDDPQPDEAPVPDTAEVENQNQNPDQPPPTPGGFRRPIPQPQGGDQPGQAFNNNNGDQQNGAKTPEQLMQELQQMQQQQQQYQQQLNPANQNPQ
jgi:hypothetical protein